MPESSSQRELAEASADKGDRLLSLDVFRGLTILAMILVNNPGSWGEMYWPLKHVEWHGWTPTDLIFPFFLFIVGTSLAYALRKHTNPSPSPPCQGGELRVGRAVYWRIVRRTALLIFLGWFPGLLFRAIGYVGGDETALDLATFRLPSVLVRIGLVYFCVSMVVLHVNLRGQIALATTVLLGYWGLLTWLPNPHDYAANLSRNGNVVGLVDRSLIGVNHMYRAGGNTDPEGVLSTLPAIVTALIGYWTGLFIQRRGVSYKMVATLAALGLVVAAVGQGWHELLPINKKIWTSSFVLLTGGLAMVGLAGCMLKFDIWGWRRLARPFEIVGVNAILVFVGSGLLATTLSRWHIVEVTVHDWMYGKIIAALTRPGIATLGWDWVTDPRFASLCYALATVAFWWLVCWTMYRLGWQIRV